MTCDILPIVKCDHDIAFPLPLDGKSREMSQKKNMLYHVEPNLLPGSKNWPNQPKYIMLWDD